ncbi:MAG: diguanylate cyclase [Aquabacterium sp.]
MSLKLGGIRARLWVATALPAMLVIAMLVAGFAFRYGERMADALQDRGVASARQLGSAAEFMVFAGDREGLVRLTEAAVRNDKQLRGVAVYDAQGQLLASAGQLTASPAPQGSLLDVQVADELRIVQPIYPTAGPVDDLYTPTPSAGLAYGPGSRLVGHAVLEMSMETLAQQQKELLLWSLVTAAGGLLLAGGLATLLASRVTAQITLINDVVARVGQGDLDERVDIHRSGVLRPLALGINVMIGRIATTQEELQYRIEQATRELRHQKEVAEQAARTDALTGTATRLAFTEVAEVEMQRALRYRNDLSLLMLDLDHFKGINDQHGHVTGDAVLVNFAQVVQQQIRNMDTLARMGGEEFVVLLPNANVAQAGALAERIRRAVSEARLMVDGKPLRVSVSIGVAQFDWRELSLTRWLARADAALYRAKDQGRNRVVHDATDGAPPEGTEHPPVEG